MVEPLAGPPGPSSPVVSAHRIEWAGGQVRLDATAIEVPARRGGGRRVRLAFEDLRRIGITPDGRALVLSSSARSYVVDASLMGGVDQVVALRRALLDRIDEHPDSVRIQSTLQRMVDLERAFAARPTRWTNAFILVCALVFAGQLLWSATLPATVGASGSGDEQLRIARLIALGANAPALVDRGEYFRLVTANFLHGGLVHFGLNVVGLWVVGPLVERVWGPARYAVLFLATCVGGAAASTWITAPPLSLGVSTALVGLVGAYFVLWLRFRGALPPAFLVSTSSWITLAVVNGAVWILVPGIDHWGHAGGGLTGAALVLLFHPPSRNAPDFMQSASRATRAAAWALVVAFAGAAVWAGATALRRPVDEGLAQILETEADRSILAANEYAWAVVTSPSASRRLLEAARHAAETAAERSTEDSFTAAVLDTAATAHYRLGDFAEAVDVSFRSVRLDPRPVSMSQLARFLQAYLQGSPPRAIGLLFPAEMKIAIDGSQLELTHSVDLPAVTVVALVRRDGRLLGGLWLQLAAAAGGAHRWDLSTEAGEALRHPGSEIEIALISTDRVTDENPDGSPTYIPIDPEIRSLP